MQYLCRRHTAGTKKSGFRTHIREQQDIDVKPGSSFEIPVTEAWERHDVYVTALVVRGGSAPSKITPARADSI